MQFEYIFQAWLACVAPLSIGNITLILTIMPTTGENKVLGENILAVLPSIIKLKNIQDLKYHHCIENKALNTYPPSFPS
jgi:hypothetical protein